MRPRRIQRKRIKGWRKPARAVYVGRPTRWGNPFRHLILYFAWLQSQLCADPHFLDPLRGKDLMCWCALDKPCHADILLALANTEKEEEDERRGL
jgi:hypothetical protein